MPIVAFVDDLFFVSKLHGTAREAGAKLITVPADEFDLEELHRHKPPLIILDLNSKSAPAVEVIRALKADAELAAVPIVGFFSHVQVELERAAREAGCDQVLPRSKFTTILPDLLKQHSTPS